MIYWLNIALTLALFVGVCVRMLNTPTPGTCWKCRLEFSLWAAAHIVIAVVVGLIFVDNIKAPSHDIPARYLWMKLCLAVLFLYPWKPKVVGL